MNDYIHSPGKVGEKIACKGEKDLEIKLDVYLPEKMPDVGETVVPMNTSNICEPGVLLFQFM